MQGGIDNVPFYIQQNPLAIYPSQGINIFLSPTLSINPNQNFLTSTPSFSISNDQNLEMNNNKLEQNNGMTGIIINTTGNNFNNNNNNFLNNQSDNVNTTTANSSDALKIENLKEDEEEDEEEEEEEEEEKDDDNDDDEENEVVSELPESQMLTYKEKIEQHPLFGLISLLFEKCEQSTNTGVINSTKAIDADIVNLLLRTTESNAVCTDNEEVDDLVQQSIKVLKIHTIELEKVQELCKDFCARYINTLKTILHPSQLVQLDADDDCDLLSSTSTNGGNNSNGDDGTSSASSCKPPFLSTASLGLGQVVSGGTVYQMVQTPQGLVAQPIQISPQLLANAGNNNHNNNNIKTTSGDNNFNSVHEQQKMDDDTSSGGGVGKHTGGRRHKRGVLPKKATKVMKAWLFQHLSHPYPTEDEKRNIASQTNLTILQVNNWFINGRRRILQPMMNSVVNSDNINKNHNNNNKNNGNNKNNAGNNHSSSGNNIITKTKRNHKKVPQLKFWSESCLGSNLMALNNGNNIKNNSNNDNNNNNNNYDDINNNKFTDSFVAINTGANSSDITSVDHCVINGQETINTQGTERDDNDRNSNNSNEIKKVEETNKNKNNKICKVYDGVGSNDDVLMMMTSEGNCVQCPDEDDNDDDEDDDEEEEEEEEDDDDDETEERSNDNNTKQDNIKGNNNSQDTTVLINLAGNNACTYNNYNNNNNNSAKTINNNSNILARNNTDNLNSISATNTHNNILSNSFNFSSNTLS